MNSYLKTMEYKTILRFYYSILKDKNIDNPKRKTKEKYKFPTYDHRGIYTLINHHIGTNIHIHYNRPIVIGVIQ